jgi:hypothetical protein
VCTHFSNTALSLPTPAFSSSFSHSSSPPSGSASNSRANRCALNWLFNPSTVSYRQPLPLLSSDCACTVPATLVTASCAASPLSASCSLLMLTYVSAAPLSADSASYSSWFRGGIFGRKFIAVGETCVDAERTRSSVNLEPATLRQRSASGSRSIGPVLRRRVDRGTEATHRGIGLGVVHCCTSEMLKLTSSAELASARHVPSSLTTTTSNLPLMFAYRKRIASRNEFYWNETLVHQSLSVLPANYYH